MDFFHQCVIFVIEVGRYAFYGWRNNYAFESPKLADMKIDIKSFHLRTSEIKGDRKTIYLCLVKPAIYHLNFCTELYSYRVICMENTARNISPYALTRNK